MRMQAIHIECPNMHWNSKSFPTVNSWLNKSSSKLKKKKAHKINSEDSRNNTLYKDRKKKVIFMHWKQPPHTQIRFCIPMFFHALIEKYTNQDREKGTIAFAAYINEANIEGGPAQTHVWQ